MPALPQDQLFSNMLRAALERFNSRMPEQISHNAAVLFDGSAFHVTSFGQQFTVAYPSYSVTPQQDQWHTLTLLHYLAMADGAPVSETQITFSQYKDGMIRGGGFDRTAERAIAQTIGRYTPEDLTSRCRALGAEILPGNADFSAKFMAFPNYPIWLKLWFADDEFPPSGRLFVSASAEHYLSIEDAVAVGELLLKKLSE